MMTEGKGELEEDNGGGIEWKEGGKEEEEGGKRGTLTKEANRQSVLTVGKINSVKGKDMNSERRRKKRMA